MAVKKTPRVVLLDVAPAAGTLAENDADWSAETADGWGEATESLPAGAPVLEAARATKAAQARASLGTATDPALQFPQGATALAVVVVDDPHRTAPDEE